MSLTFPKQRKQKQRMTHLKNTCGQRLLGKTAVITGGATGIGLTWSFRAILASAHDGDHRPEECGVNYSGVRDAGGLWPDFRIPAYRTTGGYGFEWYRETATHRGRLSIREPDPTDLK